MEELEKLRFLNALLQNKDKIKSVHAVVTRIEPNDNQSAIRELDLTTPIVKFPENTFSVVIKFF